MKKELDRTWWGAIGAVLLLAVSVVVYGLVDANAQNTQTARVEVTVWQRVSDGSLYLSTRPEGGRWSTHNTPLDMSQLSASGNFRQGGAITVDVPVVNPPAEPVAAEPVATPEMIDTDSVSVNGVGPHAGPFVLSSGDWTCTVAIFGHSKDKAWSYINVTLYGGNTDSQRLVYYEDGPTGVWESVVRVGGYLVDSVTLYEVDVSQSAEWEIICERQSP